MKPCKRCGQPITRWGADKAVYCGWVCYNATRLDAKPSKAAARKRAQRAVPLEQCSKCGGKKQLQRHHPDIENRPNEVVVLCQGCHAAGHIEENTWAVPRQPDRPCVVCGTPFRIRHHSSRTCGKKECVSALSRQGGYKRHGMSVPVA